MQGLKSNIIRCCIVIALVVTAVFFATQVYAENILYVGDTRVEEGVYYVNNGVGGLTTTDAGVANYSVYYSEGTLYLNGATITVAHDSNSSKYGIYSIEQLNIVYTGNNTIGDTESDSFKTYSQFNQSTGIRSANAGISISGDGTLNIFSGKSYGQSGYSYGIFSNGLLSFSGTGTVNITAGLTTKGTSYGIRSHGGITLTDSTVNAYGGNSPSGSGITAGLITVNSGAIKGVGGDNTTSSTGVSGDLLLNDGNVEAIGGDAQKSYGMSGSLNLNGGLLTAYGEDNAIFIPSINYDVNLNGGKLVASSPGNAFGGGNYPTYTGSYKALVSDNVDGSDSWEGRFDWSSTYTGKYLSLSPRLLIKGSFSSMDPTLPATVTITNSSGGEAVTTINVEGNANGVAGGMQQSFESQEIPPGRYNLTIAKEGYLTYTLENIEITNVSVDLTMHDNKNISNIVLATGDISDDDTVNSEDIALIINSGSYNTEVINDSNRMYDLNADNRIDFGDLAFIRNSNNFNKSNQAISFTD